MTPTQEKVSETLESWSSLNNFEHLVKLTAFWLDHHNMPDLSEWKKLKDYEELKTVVRDLLNNMIEGD